MSVFKGISSHSSVHISKILDDFFSKMSDDLLSPEFKKIKYGKNIVFSSFPPESLPSIFKIALEQKQQLSSIENDVLKKLLNHTNEYIESLRSKTKANMLNELDSYISSSAVKRVAPKQDDVVEIIRENLDSAKSKFTVVAEAEATHVRNLGRVLNIAKSGAQLGEEDPLVYFVVCRDNSTCEHCIENHLMPDKVTPRIFRLSEVNSHWLNKQQRNDGCVSLWGQHPQCRCQLQHLPPSFGFKKGKLSYIAHGHNPLQDQRDEEKS